MSTTEAPTAGLPAPSVADVTELATYLREQLVAAAAEQDQAPATRALIRAVGGMLTHRTGFAHGLAAGSPDSALLHSTVAPLYELAAQFPDCPLHWRRRAEEGMSGGPQ
ncbi:hypothetical protein AB0M58_13290 [Streptomyces bobili]|uniref:hypothetical protein n=1 Tax=Streptomyces bobili TaxID=67280 RepID=UPI00343DA5DB